MEYAADHRSLSTHEGPVARGLRRFLRGTGPEPGPVQLDLRRVFVLPTRQGLLFAVLLGTMLLGAINYDNSLAYALTFLLAGVAVAAILHTVRNLTGLRVRAGRSEPVFVGETARFTVGLENPGDRERLGVWLALPEGEPTRLDVPAEQIAWTHLERPAARRGHLPMGRFTLRGRFPLGLFVAWAHVDLGVACLVYPRPAPERGLPASAGRAAGGGEFQGQGEGDDFHALRGYQPGDSLRHVHWKAFARGQGLLTKQFGGQAADDVWLDWDTLPGLDPEARLSVLCRWVLDAAHQGRAFGLRLPGVELPPEQGAAHRQRCLETLARFGEEE